MRTSVAPASAPQPRLLGRPVVSAAVLAMVVVVFITPRFLLASDRPKAVFGLALFVLAMPLVMFALSASFRWTRARRMGPLATLALSLGVAGALGPLLAMAAWAAAISFGFPPERITTAPRAAGVGLFTGLLHCAAWALAFVYPFAVEEARLRAMESDTLRLEADRHRLEAEALRLETAQLKSAFEVARLRSQLEPHFLLNTLNAIAGFVTHSPDEARRLLVCLGDLLRGALDEADEPQTLDEEIAWLQRYADILESRHSGALRFRWEVADDAGGVLVPRMLLQPLVENAVKHGALQRKGGGGEVVVRASVTRDAETGSARLMCTVEDNGPGIADDAPRSGAFGLRAVRRRLQLEYLGATLELDSSPEGTRSIVQLPDLRSRPAAIAAGAR